MIFVTALKQHMKECAGCLKEPTQYQKIPIVVTGSDGEVYMDEIPIDKDGDVPQNNPQGVGRGRGGVGIADRPICEQLLALHSQQSAIRRMIIELG